MLFNDSLGHHAGDLLLRTVARRLESCLRPTDTLARIGGDEFAILIEAAEHIDRVAALAERICSVLKATFHVGSQDLFTMCSLGIVEIVGGYQTAEEILRDADIAMYEAKAHRTGSYVLFASAMRGNASAMFQLQTDLHHALSGREFYLVYQLIHESGTKRIAGMEALVRWRPTRGMVPPSDFIPMAEKIGIINELGRWALREACLQTGAWQKAYPGAGLRLSVNVSALQFPSRTLQQEVVDALDASGMQPRDVQIEITENVFLHDPEHIGRVLHGLRALGIRIALDDFGTGYSSLGYIDKFPIDAIKIDGSFTARMESHPRTMAIVDSIMALGRGLNVDVIAEGVETGSQLDILRRVHCPYIQAYLWAKPMDAAESAPFSGKNTAAPQRSPRCSAGSDFHAGKV